MYRYWMPLAYTDDEVLRSEIRDMAAAGAGGVEIAPFIVPGAGNQSNAFLAEYGWGTPTWAHKIEVITDEAAKLGLSVDQSLGPQYPPTVPSLNSFNQPEVEQQLIYGREFHAPGDPARRPAGPDDDDPVGVDPAVRPGHRRGRGAAGPEPRRIGPRRRHHGRLRATAEQVTVTSIGDRLAECADLGVSGSRTSTRLMRPSVPARRRGSVHWSPNAPMPAANRGAGQVLLDPSSVVDVTDDVIGGALDYDFPAGQRQPVGAPGLPAGAIRTGSRSAAGTPRPSPTTWSITSAVAARRSRGLLGPAHPTDAVRANLDRIGRGASSRTRSNSGPRRSGRGSSSRNSRTAVGTTHLLLPALAGAGIQGTQAPAFEFAGLGAQVREDYRQTMSDLFVDEYVSPMQEWAAARTGLPSPAYGIPIPRGRQPRQPASPRVSR